MLLLELNCSGPLLKILKSKNLLIEKYFSKIEVFAMIKYPKEVFDYTGFFGQTRFEK